MALVPLQADIERALTNFIRDELNSNSFGVHFSLGYWTNTTDRDGQNVEIMEVEGAKYETEEVRVVPMSIEAYDGNITNIEGLFNADYNVPLTFQINVDDEQHFEDVISAINEVKNTLRGQIKRLEVSHNGLTEKFTAVTATDNLTPQGNLTIMMGQTYAFAGLSISFDISKNINYGNQVWIYLAEYDETTNQTLPDNENTDYVRIFALAPSFNRTNNPEAFQNFDTKDVVHIIKDSEYTFAMQMFIQDNDLHWSLLEDVIKKENLNKPYSLKLDFKYYDINDDLVTKFSFVEPVVILDATPSFSIGEPQYLEVAFGKYLTESEVTDPGEIPETPDLPQLPQPSLKPSVGSLEIITPPNSPLGYSITRFFVNESETDTVDIRVCVGSQCVTVENIEPGLDGEFTFTGLKQEVEYTFNAVALGDGENFNDSEPRVIFFSPPTLIETPFNVVDTIGEVTTNGFEFTLENPNDYPLQAYVDFNNSFSQAYLLNANTTATFNYENNSLVQDTNNVFTFVYNSLSEYGEVISEETTNRTVFIPSIPQAENPEIKNISTTRSETEVTVSWQVQNKHTENVDIITSIGSDSFSELDVPKLGDVGDTVNFSITYTDPADTTQEKTITAQALSRIQGELDSQEVSDVVDVPGFATSDLDVEWVPTSQTDRIIFDVTNNNSYETGFDLALYFEGQEIDGSLRTTSSALYSRLSNGQTERFEFINGDNGSGLPDLVIEQNGVDDFYELGVRSTSSQFTPSDIEFYEGQLARQTTEFGIVSGSISTTSDLEKSYINFRLFNSEDNYSTTIFYGIGTSSTFPQINLTNSVTVGPNQSSDEIQLEVNDFDIEDDHYIYYNAKGISLHLLESENFVSGAITPEPLKVGFEVEFVDFDDTLIEEAGFENPQFVEQGEDAVAPSNPSRNYYTFDSWDTVFTNVQQNLTVKAQYDPNDYTITYALGTSGTTNTNPDTYNIEDLPVDLVDPTKEGYEFNGWFKEQAFTNEITQINQTNFPTLGNITIYGDLQEVTLDNYVVTVTDTTIDSITISITNPSSNPVDSGAAAFITLRDSLGNEVETGTTYTLTPGLSDSKTFSGLSDNTTYEIGGNGTNNAIVTVDNQGIYLSNEQEAIDVTTPENVGDKTLRVKLNIFGPTTTASVGWEINDNVQSSITANNNSFTTFSTTLFNTDNITINAPQTAGGQSFLNFVVNGVTKTVPTFEITEPVGDGLDIEINYQ